VERSVALLEQMAACGTTFVRTHTDVEVLSQDFARLGLVKESVAPLKGESPR
jgi:hypothetical protein